MTAFWFKINDKFIINDLLFYFTKLHFICIIIGTIAISLVGFEFIEIESNEIDFDQYMVRKDSNLQTNTTQSFNKFNFSNTFNHDKINYINSKHSYVNNTHLNNSHNIKNPQIESINLTKTAVSQKVVDQTNKTKMTTKSWTFIAFTDLFKITKKICDIAASKKNRIIHSCR